WGDLERIARVPGASVIEPLDGPGGGERVRLPDPSGFLVEAIHGQPPVSSIAHRAALPLNLVDVAHRINETQRPPVAPPEVIKLGHVVLE
ncbi:hypothetical protein KQ880_15260, partial [Listeria monocytogenes]|nr:hypothetical protein [Listeria monocytogenes]